jgi:hypothetical protein
LAAVLGSFVLLAAAPSASADGTSECLSSFVNAQELRKAGKLVGAREQAAACGRDACPRQLRDECVTWVRELDASIPSIVLFVRTPENADAGGARVLVDGLVLPDALDGRGHGIDPGPHVIRAESPSFDPVEVSVLIHQGERDRPVELSLRPRAKAAEAPRPSLLPVAIPAAVGAVGIGVFAAFDLWGYYGSPGYQSLSHDCSPRCSPSDVDSVRTRFVVADVGLGVALAAAGVATAIWLVRGHPPNGAAATAGASGAGLGVSF